MRGIYTILVFLMAFLVSCYKGQTNKECPDLSVDKFLYNYKVHYELRRYVSTDGKNKIQNGPIKLDLVSNSEKVVEINIDDSTLIGVEIAVFPLVFREDTTLVFDIIYYEPSLDNKWIPKRKGFEARDLHFETKLISYSNYVGSDFESDPDDPNLYKLIHSVTFERNKKK